MIVPLGISTFQVYQSTNNDIDCIKAKPLWKVTYFWCFTTHRK